MFHVHIAGVWVCVCASMYMQKNATTRKSETKDTNVCPTIPASLIL